MDGARRSWSRLDCAEPALHACFVFLEGTDMSRPSCLASLSRSLAAVARKGLKVRRVPKARKAIRASRGWACRESRARRARKAIPRYISRGDWQSYRVLC